MGPDFAGSLKHEGEVGMPVAAPRRRPHGDEDRIGGLGRRGELGGEEQALLARILGNKLRQPGLEDRHLAAQQRRHLVGVLVDAGHDVTEVGQAGA